MRKSKLFACCMVSFAAFLVIVYSCNKKDQYWSSPTSGEISLSISDAQHWYERKYSTEINKIKNIDKFQGPRMVSYARGVFAGVPDWRYHQHYRRNRNALMIPLDFSDPQTKYTGFRDIIITKNNSKKTFNSYVQLEIFNKRYLDSLINKKGNLPDIRSYSDPMSFTGEVLLFSSHNEFIRGAQYKNGRIIARIFPRNGIKNMIKSISNSFNSEHTYVPFNGGANLEAMTRKPIGKKVALNSNVDKQVYEEAPVHKSASNSSDTDDDTGDSDDTDDSIWDGSGLEDVTVIATMPNTYENPWGDTGDDWGDSYPTDYDPPPAPPTSGGGGGTGGGGGSTVGSTSYETMTDDDIQRDIDLSNFIDLSLQKPRPKFTDLKSHTLPASYNPSQVGAAIGGEVANELGSNGNTCATRVSYALNHSNNPIPSGAYTFDGADGMNYIVGARTLLSYLKSAYGATGTTIHLSSQNSSLSQQDIKSKMSGKQGIYVIIPNDPSVASGFGASGHVDILSADGGFSSGHAFYSCQGGVSDVYLFQLNN
ncbi:MAG TPA: T6SS effector amidase Tae4 family protein [Arachidicoccus sp.]|nr:T6SS effector amidase Tae4 family protein [Arachidicoccus sp.]